MRNILTNVDAFYLRYSFWRYCTPGREILIKEMLVHLKIAVLHMKFLIIIWTFY
jgi:hypothetical protein